MTLAAPRPDAFVGMDARGRITEWNEAAETISGGPAKRRGRSSPSIVPPDRRRSRSRSRALPRDREGPVLNKNVEVKALRSDGTSSSSS